MLEQPASRAMFPPRRVVSPPPGSELLFQRLREMLPAGAYACDADGLITYFNPHAVRPWGREPRLNDPVERFCGSFRLYAGDGKPIAHEQCWMALALQLRQEYNGQEIVIERPDRQRLTMLAHANPVFDDAGSLLGAVNVLVDISQQKDIGCACEIAASASRRSSWSASSSRSSRSKRLMPAPMAALGSD